MVKIKEIAVLYSGGTDSTCVAFLMAKEVDKVHLLVYKRFGLFSIDNIATNAKKLRERFGEDKFVYKVIDLNRLFKEVSYAKYWHNLKNYGFFMLSTCGLCKLAMHIRTLIYCLENNIKYVCDGANKNAGAGYFPAQMLEVIDLIEEMYAQYGVSYSRPVFDFDEPKGITWVDKLGLEKLQLSSIDTGKEETELTSGKILFKENLFPRENVKGTKIDHKMQARCFQLILFNIFLYWYYLPVHGSSKYKETAVNFYQEKVEYFRALIDEYLEKKSKSRLYNFIQ